MNNREIYKAAMSGVRHSDEAIERIFDMTTDKKKTRIKPAYKRLAAAALALVLLIGGGFGISRFTDKSDDLTVIVAYAGDNGELYFGGKSEQPLFYGIYTAPKSDKKACEEAANRRSKDQTKLLNEMDGEAEKGSYASYGSGSRSCYNKDGEETAVFYTLSGGEFELNLEDYSDVKSFKLNNVSGYGILDFEYCEDIEIPDDVYKEMEAIEDFDALPPEKQEYYEQYYKAIQYRHEWELTGDELRYSQQAGYAKGGKGRYKTNKGYLLFWDVSDELVSAVSEDPSFDLTQIKDTITFTVTFNDGTVKTASLNLYFDKDGYMHFD